MHAIRHLLHGLNRPRLHLIGIFLFYRQCINAEEGDDLVYLSSGPIGIKDIGIIFCLVQETIFFKTGIERLEDPLRIIAFFWHIGIHDDQVRRISRNNIIV